MDDFKAIFTEKAAWPMIHVFIPAIIAIYAQNIWITLSIIYLFESVEYMISVIPGNEYWSDVGANALVSDIIMGLVGAWLVKIIGETEYKSDQRTWYTPLKYRKSCCGCYKQFQPFFHVGAAAASTSIASAYIMMDILPDDCPQAFIYFGILYVLFAILFGKDRFAAIAAVLIVIISVIAIFTGYTMIVTFAVVFTYFLFNKLKTNEDYKSGQQVDVKEKQSPELYEFIF